jgi:hypothetical protein
MTKPQNWKRKSLPGNSLIPIIPNRCNGTARLKKYKQLFEYQHLLLLKDIWWSKFKIYINMLFIFQHQQQLKTVIFWHWCIICSVLLQMRNCNILLMSRPYETFYNRNDFFNSGKQNILQYNYLCCIVS